MSSFYKRVKLRREAALEQAGERNQKKLMAGETREVMMGGARSRRRHMGIKGPARMQS